MKKLLSETLIFVLFLFGAILVVTWIILPFGIFGIKTRLDKTNMILSEILRQLSGGKVIKKVEVPTYLTSEEPKQNPYSEYFENYCSNCISYEEPTGACKKIYENVRQYPKKIIDKCNGKYYEMRK